MTKRAPASLHLVGAAPHRLEIRVLGRFALLRDGLPVDLSGWQRRPAALLRLLAASGGRVTRDDVIEIFWPESAPGKGAANLRQALYQLRRELGASPPPVIVEGGWVALNPALDWEIDLAAFQTAAAAAGDDPEALEAALDLYGGEPLLEDRYEDWATPVREHIHHMYREVVLRVARLHRARGSAAQALHRIGAVLEVDPFDEAAIRLQLEILGESGRRADALKSYTRFEERLARELELEPEAETMAVVEEIAQGVRVQPDPVRVPVPPPHNLPAAMSSFVGRTDHASRLRALLARDEVRLITLTGPGGTGKTRLALEVARSAVSSYPDGVFLVSLAPLTDPELIPFAVASALGIKERGTEPIVQTIKGALGAKRLLLILDNFEHLLPAALRVSELLSACPRLTVLATSRERLHLYGEHEYPVPPLSLPTGDRTIDRIESVRSDAVTLFVDRAQAARPEFELSAENAAAVGGICRSLDGLPLAIELAAARMTHFDPDALLARLERRLAVVAGGPRDVSERHQTLRGAIDWSFSLLSESEQAIFARLSVFLGGCTMEAAEAVCDPAGELRLLAGVESLAQKSLLRLDGVGEPRISMLETIREYAVEKLGEVGETETLRDRHTRYFAHLPQAMGMGDPASREPGHPHGLKRLEADVDNLRAALSWCQTRGKGELGLRLYSALFWFWEMRGEFSEGQRWANALLVHRHGANRRVQAVALWVAGVVSGRGEQYERAGEYLEESLTLFREVGDRRGMSWALLWLGNVAAAFDDLERAIALEVEGRELAQRDGERWVAAIASANLGRFALQRGDLTQAQELFEETLAGYREAGHTGYVSGMLYQLAALALQQGELERGKTLLTEALAAAIQVGHRQVLIQCLIATADLAVREQERARAARLLGAAEAANARTGAAWSAERVTEAARAQMSETAWRRAWQEGWDTPLDEAVAAAVAYAAR